MRTPLLASLITAACLLAAGCSGTKAPTQAEPTATPPSTPTSTTTVAALTASGADGGRICLERTGVADFGYWGERLVATTPLEITGVRASGQGGEVIGGLLAPVIGGSMPSGGVLDWPMREDRLFRKEIVWAERTGLVGAHLPVQRAMLPVVHLRLRTGDRMTGLVYRYRTDAGDTGELTVPITMRLARHC